MTTVTSNVPYGRQVTRMCVSCGCWGGAHNNGAGYAYGIFENSFLFSFAVNLKLF